MSSDPWLTPWATLWRRYALNSLAKRAIHDCTKNWRAVIDRPYRLALQPVGVLYERPKRRGFKPRRNTPWGDTKALTPHDASDSPDARALFERRE